MCPVGKIQIFHDLGHSFVGSDEQIRGRLQTDGHAEIRQGHAGVLFYIMADIGTAVVQGLNKLRPSDSAMAVLRQIADTVEYDRIGVGKQLNAGYMVILRVSRRCLITHSPTHNHHSLILARRQEVAQITSDLLTDLWRK